MTTEIRAEGTAERHEGYEILFHSGEIYVDPKTGVTVEDRGEESGAKLTVPLEGGEILTLDLHSGAGVGITRLDADGKYSGDMLVLCGSSGW